MPIRFDPEYPPLPDAAVLRRNAEAARARAIAEFFTALRAALGRTLAAARSARFEHPVHVRK
jgi:hypothetical protein